MLKWLLPLGAKGMDFMYAYDARTVYGTNGAVGWAKAQSAVPTISS